ncbi:hypothetical protein Fmac_017232 [Flemingia macrophylla]|uniref:Uncharacterized protein n=1 Tax=Flemingia macrophylla TaxID=520843 RepID=A0ABD1M1I2_9FABA
MDMRIQEHKKKLHGGGESEHGQRNEVRTTLTFQHATYNTVLSAKDISRLDRSFLLLFLVCAVQSEVLKLIYQFGNAKPLLLSFTDDFDKLWLLIRDETAIMVLYELIFLFTWPVQPAYRVVAITILLGIPIYYAPNLRQKMSGVDVSWGFFQLPLFFVTTPLALALGTIFSFMVLYVNYRMQRYLSPQSPTGTKSDDGNTIEDSLIKDNIIDDYAMVAGELKL